MLRLLKMALSAVVLTMSVWANGGVTNSKVALWLSLPGGLAPLISSQIERELQTIIEPSGLQLQWLRLPEQTGAVVDGQSIVVRFRGACEPALGPGRRLQPAAWAHVSDSKVLPFIEVDCDQVWSVIEADLASEPAFHRELYFGRALARVLAHELYHVLSNSMEHGSGLTKARLDSRDLIGGRYTLSQANLTPAVRIAVPPATVSSESRPSWTSGYSTPSSSFAAGDVGR